ncbi:MAG: hypothetical protein Q9166_000893 [cf. Caloplaca sp. 2 TL-2023]
MSRLPNLPSELIESIAGYLNLQDLRNFRLVNHLLKVESNQAFTKLRYKIISTDLSIQSFQTLKDLASNPQLSRHVRTLRIRPLPNPNNANNPTLGGNFPRPRHRDSSLQFPTLCTTELEHLLTNGFLNCRSFSIHGRYRSKDPTYRFLYSRQPHPITDISDLDSINILLNLITQTGISVKSFAIRDLGESCSPREGRRHRRDSQSSLTPLIPDTELFHSGWSAVEELHLEPTDLRKQGWMRELAFLAPNLTNLILIFGSNDVSALDKFSRPTTWRLRSSRVEGARVTPENLFDLLGYSTHSLRALSISRTLGDDVRAYNWKQIFRELGDPFAVLERLELRMLQEEPPVDEMGPEYSYAEVVWFDVGVAEGWVRDGGEGGGRFEWERVEDWEGMAVGLVFEGKGRVMRRGLEGLGKAVRYSGMVKSGGL